MCSIAIFIGGKPKGHIVFDRHLYYEHTSERAYTNEDKSKPLLYHKIEDVY
jgi:hypothetical protein